MQFTTGTIHMALLTIAIGMHEMPALVKSMVTIMKTEVTPLRQLAALVGEVILVFGMLFVKADELLEMLRNQTLML